MKLQVITASTRPVRIGEPIATWFIDRARKHGKFEVEPVDLKQVNLPMFDEPEHPRFGRYVHEHTRKWSETIRSADAYVFVAPEYNFGPTPALVNALDYLHAEWAYKAAGFVSYGGVSGGSRAVQMTKLILTGLKVMPMFEGVYIPWVNKEVENGVFKSSEAFEKSAVVLLDELHKWAQALRPMRGL